MSDIQGLLLAAGLGTRLRPLTAEIPKCLVKIGGITMLDRWIEEMDEIGCQEVIINTHYLAEQVAEHLSKRKKVNIKIEVQYESQLLGTAGTLIKNRECFNCKTGLLIHTDNITSKILARLIAAHKQRPNGCLLTMLTFDSVNPKECGIIETDGKGVLVGFHEKVSDPPGNKANGAVYVFEPDIFEEIEKANREIKDFSNDVIPLLIGKIYTYHTNEDFIDIGTPSTLKIAREIWGGEG